MCNILLDDNGGEGPGMGYEKKINKFGMRVRNNMSCINLGKPTHCWGVQHMYTWSNIVA